MEKLIQPFLALRPHPQLAESVIAPPYDVLNDSEARVMVQDKPNSFLHISKPQVDLSDSIDPYSEIVYQKGKDNFEKLKSGGILVRDTMPCFYIYRIERDGHQQTGVSCVASVEAYDSNIIKKHELTRPQKEDDRVKQISSLKAQTGPVLLVHKKSSEIKETISLLSNSPPDYRVVSNDGNIHSLWVINNPSSIDQITSNFNNLDQLYIADGHHRSAAASRVAKFMKNNKSAQFFLSVIFPEDELQILPYNRLIRSLNGLSPQELLNHIGKSFDVSVSEKQFQPENTQQFGMYLEGKWYKLSFKKNITNNDPVSSLDVSILHDEIIEPFLGIIDPRRDSSIDFVGGVRGLKELSDKVDSGKMQLAFSLFSTHVKELMLVADSNKIMPPKSTWFEPKLVDGLISHMLD